MISGGTPDWIFSLRFARFDPYTMAMQRTSYSQCRCAREAAASAAEKRRGLCVWAPVEALGFSPFRVISGHYDDARFDEQGATTAFVTINISCSLRTRILHRRGVPTAHRRRKNTVCCCNALGGRGRMTRRKTTSHDDCCTDARRQWNVNHKESIRKKVIKKKKK